MPPSRESTNGQLLLCSVKADGCAAREPDTRTFPCVDNVQAVRHRDSSVIVQPSMLARRGRGRPRQMGPSQNVFI